MAASKGEKIQQIAISELHPFEGHPFKVVDDDLMTQTVESIRDYGITTPLLVRPDKDGGYEIVSGHRRHHAAELSGMDAVPCIVREMDDDTAIITMVDSNLQSRKNRRRNSMRNASMRTVDDCRYSRKKKALPFGLLQNPMAGPSSISVCRTRSSPPQGGVLQGFGGSATNKQAVNPIWVCIACEVAKIREMCSFAVNFIIPNFAGSPDFVQIES